MMTERRRPPMIWSSLPLHTCTLQKLISWGVITIVIIIINNANSSTSRTASATFISSGTSTCTCTCTCTFTHYTRGRLIVGLETTGGTPWQSFLRPINNSDDKRELIHRHRHCHQIFLSLTKNDKSHHHHFCRRNFNSNCSPLRVRSSSSSSLLSEDNIEVETIKVKEKDEETETFIEDSGISSSQTISTTPSSSSSSSSSSSIHLISLPPLLSSDGSSKSSPKLIREIWKWKDVVLGDGRDYFIPRPRALKALSDILIGSTLAVPLDLFSEEEWEEEEEDGQKEREGVERDQKDSERWRGGEIHFVIKECAILSNCARMDILLSIETTRTLGTAGTTWKASAVKDTKGSATDCNSKEIDMMQNQKLPSARLASQILVANCLLDQLSSYQAVRKERGSTAPLWEGISSFFDLPGMVIVDESSCDAHHVGTNANFDVNNNNVKSKRGDNSNSVQRGIKPKPTSIVYLSDVQQSTKDLGMKLLRTTSQLEDIVQHFCLVAAGLARRDSRPDREVHFRPFSSRDAHIMLQLKRSAEVAMHYPKMKIILDTALSAGKSSRDVNKVPILKKLKKYDCEGKYSTAAPRQLALEAIEDVKEMAIRPVVEKCLMKLKAQKNSERIIYFKSQVDGIIKERNNYGKNNNADSEIIKKLTHDTIMKLRDGRDVDLEEVFLKINERNTSIID